METINKEDFKSTILNRFDETIEVFLQLKNMSNDIELVAQMILNCLKNGNKLLLCGNGGSAADAQHIAAEFIGKFYRIDRPGLPAISLNTNSSIMTALANDFDYDMIFSRQVEALGKKGDVLFGISTSGNSKNVIQAVKLATQKGMNTITLTGASGGELANISDITIKVPSSNTPIIQNAHIAIRHTICELVESQF